MKKTVATTADGDSDVIIEKLMMPSSMDALNRTLVYGHVAPTGPDSLPTFPSSDTDPFVLTSRPDVYFAGNCEEFETRLVDGRGVEINDMPPKDGSYHTVTRLVCIPSFALTGEVVLVKLRTLECEVLSFNDATLCWGKNMPSLEREAE